MTSNDRVGERRHQSARCAGRRSALRRRSVLFGGFALVVAAVAGSAVLAANLVACGAATSPAEADQRSTEAEAAGTRGVTVFFVGHGQLVPVSRDVLSGQDATVAAVEALLRGPTEREREESIDSAIPAGTRLVDATADGTVVTLELSEGLVGNARGTLETDEAYQAGLAQIVYTATAVAGVEAVELSAPDVAARSFRRDDFVGLSLVGSSPPSNVADPSASAAGQGIDPDDAEEVQERLVELAYLPESAVNGSYDDRTTQAVMAFQAWEALVPDGVVGDLTAAALDAAEPPEPVHEGDGRWVEIHRDEGTILLVEDGSTVRAVHTSTGESGDEPPHATPPGSFVVTAKALKDWSEPYEVWMPYACYFNGGIAIHGADAVPPWPASHGCVRVPKVEAPVVYRFVSVGTPVYVD